jgi:hypothetical protein
VTTASANDTGDDEGIVGVNAVNDGSRKGLEIQPRAPGMFFFVSSTNYYLQLDYE